MSDESLKAFEQWWIDNGATNNPRVIWSAAVAWSRAQGADGEKLDDLLHAMFTAAHTNPACTLAKGGEDDTNCPYCGARWRYYSDGFDDQGRFIGKCGHTWERPVDRVMTTGGVGGDGAGVVIGLTNQRDHVPAVCATCGGKKFIRGNAFLSCPDCAVRP